MSALAKPIFKYILIFGKYLFQAPHFITEARPRAAVLNFFILKTTQTRISRMLVFSLKAQLERILQVRLANFAAAVLLALDHHKKSKTTVVFFANVYCCRSIDKRAE